MVVMAFVVELRWMVVQSATTGLRIRLDLRMGLQFVLERVQFATTAGSKIAVYSTIQFLQAIGKSLQDINKKRLITASMTF